VRKGRHKRGCDYHVRQELISSDFVEGSGGGSLTVRFGEEVMEEQPF
jgi:hypothetical protein